MNDKHLEECFQRMADARLLLDRIETDMLGAQEFRAAVIDQQEAAQHMQARHTEAMALCLRMQNHLIGELLTVGVRHEADDTPCEYAQDSGPRCVNPLHVKAASLEPPRAPLDLGRQIAEKLTFAGCLRPSNAHTRLETIWQVTAEIINETLRARTLPRETPAPPAEKEKP